MSRLAEPITDVCYVGFENPLRWPVESECQGAGSVSDYFCLTGSMPLVSRDTVQTKTTCNPGQVEPPRTGDEEEAAIDITNVRGGAHGMNAHTTGSPLPSVELFPYVSQEVLHHLWGCVSRHLGEMEREEDEGWHLHFNPTPPSTSRPIFIPWPISCVPRATCVKNESVTSGQRDNKSPHRAF